MKKLILLGLIAFLAVDFVPAQIQIVLEKDLKLHSSTADNTRKRIRAAEQEDEAVSPQAAEESTNDISAGSLDNTTTTPAAKVGAKNAVATSSVASTEDDSESVQASSGSRADYLKKYRDRQRRLKKK